MKTNYGDEFNAMWPNTVPKYSKFVLNMLKSCVNINRPEPLSIQELKNNSDKFPIKFRIDSCRIKSQPTDKYSFIETQAASAYPLIHERVLWLYIRFLEHKNKYGDDDTKQVLRNISLADFIDRLLQKRCVSFLGQNDRFMLLNGEKGFNCYKSNPTKSLANLISYDEIKLSALLSVSSRTEFINDGNRKNSGKIQSNKQLIETNGVIIGIIGARLQKPGFMEFQEICLSPNQNTKDNGYGSKPEKFNSSILEAKFDYRSIWNEFYNQSSLMYNEVKGSEARFGKCNKDKYIFDNVAMKKRYSISFDTLLLESQARAKQFNKNAYIHVVGIGLGVWKVAAQQEEIFLQVFEQRLKCLADKLTNIGWVNFAWFQMDQCGDIRNGNVIKSQGNQRGIKILMSKRNPADKLCGEEYQNAQLIVSYAWDGNALPGNEFWLGWLSSTGDSAAACSTLITELHNPHINTTMVSGNNLHVLSERFGVTHISDYVKKFLCES